MDSGISTASVRLSKALLLSVHTRSLTSATIIVTPIPTIRDREDVSITRANWW